MSTGKRLYFIDVARAIAIVLAMLSHFMIAFDGWQGVGNSEYILKPLTRTATPLFIILFGMMLELVYVRRAKRKNGFRSVARRLTIRSFQCYLGYAATAVAGYLGGILTAEDTFNTLIFTRNAYFGNILRFYFFALLAAVPLLLIRMRLGTRSILFMLVGIWIVHYGTLPFHSTDLDSYSKLAGIIFGVVGAPEGPSVAHGFTFVGVGMLLSRGLMNWKSTGLSHFYRRCATVCLICLAIVAVLVYHTSPLDVGTNFTRYTAYRLHNHPGYYAIGTVGSISILILTSLVVPAHRSISQWGKLPLTLGTSSLMSYTLANVFINLCISELSLDINYYTSLFYFFIFITVVVLAVKLTLYLSEIRALEILSRNTKTAS